MMRVLPARLLCVWLPALLMGACGWFDQSTDEEDEHARLGEPAAVGSPIEVASGVIAGTDETWRLVAYLAPGGVLCVEVRGTSCGPIPSVDAPVAAVSIDPSEARASCAYGALAPSAASVALEFSDGTFLILPARRAAGLPAAFYVQCWPGPADLTAVAVFDQGGRQLASTSWR